MSEIRSQATPARDELERSAIGWQQYISRALGCKPGQLTYQLEECIEKIEALKPRTVNSAAELDALPVGSVVRDKDKWVGEIVTVAGRKHVFWAGNECEAGLDEISFPRDRPLHSGGLNMTTDRCPVCRRVISLADDRSTCRHRDTLGRTCPMSGHEIPIESTLSRKEATHHGS